MDKEVNDYVNQIWNKEAKRQFENELSFVLKEKIELPDGKDYLKIFDEIHKTDEQIIEELQQKLDKIKFYIEQSDIKDMLWGKEILEIIEKN